MITFPQIVVIGKKETEEGRQNWRRYALRTNQLAHCILLYIISFLQTLSEFFETRILKFEE
jgi:hypothetical protein